MITDKTPCKGLGTLRFIGGGVYANHHELRYLETKKEYFGDWADKPPRVIQRYYCIFCGEILEKEDS